MMTDCAGKLVTELRSKADSMHASVAGVTLGDTFHAANWSDKPHRVLYDALKLMRRAAALIESQRATIERVEQEAGLIGSACDKLRVAHSQEMRQGLALRDELRRQLEAAEARVAVLEAEMAGDHAILRDLVASLNRRGQTLSISHDELSALEARAAQALSRSSTEAGDGA